MMLEASVRINEKATLIYSKLSRWCVCQRRAIEENVAIGFAQNDFESSSSSSFSSLSLFLSLCVNLSISIYLYLYQQISKSSLDCGVKSITVLMRWHRAYIIFLWISISADTSHRRGSLDEMQMARYVNANLPSGRHEHNEDGVHLRRGFCDAITFRSLSFHGWLTCQTRCTLN